MKTIRLQSSILGSTSLSQFLVLLWKKEWNRRRYLWYSEDGDLLLLEVSPVLFIYEDEIEVVACAELFIDVSECRRQFEASEE